MIASSGFLYTGSNYSGTTATIYTIQPSSSSNYEPWGMTLYLPHSVTTDPKRKIPFYRALFDQRWPQKIEPNAARTSRRPWQIHAGKREARPVSRFV